MAEVDLRHVVGRRAEQNSDFGLVEAELVTEMIGSDTIRTRTEGLEGE
jgi:hypothetical protein